MTTSSLLEITRRLIAWALVAAGLYLAAFGNSWAPSVHEWLSGSEIGVWVELIAPFLPMGFIALGAFLFASHNRG